MDSEWVAQISAASASLMKLNSSRSRWASLTDLYVSSTMYSSDSVRLNSAFRTISGGSVADGVLATILAQVDAEIAVAENTLLALMGGFLLPVITSVSPNTAGLVGGVPITISGAYLQGATAVSFGGTPATSVHPVGSAGLQVTATLPAGVQGAVDVQVTTPIGGGIAHGLFTYLPPAPTVAAILPVKGSHNGGTNVTITGTNFIGATAVLIGGVAVTSFVVVNATTITAVSAAHPVAAAVNVSVTNPGGTGTGIGLYQYT